MGLAQPGTGAVGAVKNPNYVPGTSPVTPGTPEYLGTSTGGQKGGMGATGVNGSNPYGNQGGPGSVISASGGPVPRSTTAVPTPQQAAAAAPTYGTDSGPGILQQWFSQRANGTDPGWEYAMGRAKTALDNAYASRGGFNSGAAFQGQGDMMANAMSQREAQLDALAGGASGERQGAINSMFGTGLGLAGGQAGTAGQYDTSAANAMSTSLATQLALAINKAGVNSQGNQQGASNLLGIGKLLA